MPSDKQKQIFDFPTEIVNEGDVRVAVPKLEAFINAPGDYAPSKAPVFYNPLMEINRDLAVLALQSYQRVVKRDLVVSEPLAGCGIRGIRFASEIKCIQKIFLNDINPEAVKLTQYNVITINHLDGIVSVTNEDANLFLSRYAAPHKRFDFIDIDPFGSPVAYVDSAIRALRDGGLIALTATDMAPLCGVYPNVSLRKYGGISLRTEYCHELAVRLLAGYLARMAAKYNAGVKILFSHSTDHYIRIYAALNHGAKRAEESIRKMGYILHCFICLHREAHMDIAPYLKGECKICGSHLKVAGPLWLDKICDRDLCESMEQENLTRNLRNKRRILKLISLIKGESDGPSTYYVLDRICDKFDLPVPPLKDVMDELRKAGFQVVPTHFNNSGFRTNAPAEIMKEIILKVSN